MRSGEPLGRPGVGSVALWAVLGGAASLATGLFVAAALNTYLAIDWVRGLATLAAGAAVAGSLLRLVILAARAKLRSGDEDPGPDR